MRVCRFLVWTVLSAGGLFAQTPRHAFDKQVDFSHFRTYAWLVFPHAMNLGELTGSQVRGTLQVALAKRGLPSRKPLLPMSISLTSSSPAIPETPARSMSNGRTPRGWKACWEQKEPWSSCIPETCFSIFMIPRQNSSFGAPPSPSL